MSTAPCQLSAWTDECLKISRINSHHGLQTKEKQYLPHSLCAIWNERNRRHPLIKYMTWGMGDV